MRKEHAEHNEKACDFLYKDGNFNDWVVTTAFYSAIHFVRHKIFPITKYNSQLGHDVTYQSLDQYVNHHDSASDNKLKELRILVEENISQIKGRYRWLSNLCHTSRYHNYKVSLKKAKLAREHLKEIKQACQ